MSAPDRAIWDDILSHLRRNHLGLCRRWFDEIVCLGVDAGALRLRVDQPVRRHYLERECSGAFAEAAQAVTGMLLSVKFVGPGQDGSGHASNGHSGARAAAAGVAVGLAVGLVGNGPQAQGTSPAPGHTGLPRGAESLVISPDYTFDNFVQGPENRLAYAAAVAVAENPGRAYNPVFLHGGVGLGKTHLLQAICTRILEQEPGAVIHYVSCEGFITQFMESVQSGQMANFRHRFRDVDVLVIDDIHFLAKRDRTQEEFFHTFNTLFQAHKQIVLSSDAPPDQIPDLEERLVSRFKWGLVAELERPGYETRVAIVKKKASLRGVPMPDDAACLIAARVESNIRELEGAILRIQIQGQVENRPIDRSLAETVLKETQTVRKAPTVTIPIISDVVADFFSVKLSDLQGKRRQKSIAHPRQICMYIARHQTRHSLEEIGDYFGGRDHTTVMHAVRTIGERMATDPSLVEVIRALEQRIVRPA